MLLPLTNGALLLTASLNPDHAEYPCQHYLALGIPL